MKSTTKHYSEDKLKFSKKSCKHMVALAIIWDQDREVEISDKVEKSPLSKILENGIISVFNLNV